MTESWRTRLTRWGFIAAIRAELEHAPQAERTLTVDLVGADGTVHATVEKVLHIRRRGAEAGARPAPSAAPAGAPRSGMRP